MRPKNLQISSLKSLNIFVKKCCTYQNFVLLYVHKIRQGGFNVSDSENNNAFLRGNQLYENLLKQGTNDIEALTTELLMFLGFKFKLSGTVYLKAAILYLYYKNYRPHVIFHNQVYAAVAEQYATTQIRVERAIRTAVCDSNTNGNLVALNELLHNNITQPEYPPSNCELISCIASWLRLQHQKGHVS